MLHREYNAAPKKHIHVYGSDFLGFLHWKERTIVMPIQSQLVTPNVVAIKTSGDVDKVGIMTTVGF